MTRLQRLPLPGSTACGPRPCLSVIAVKHELELPANLDPMTRHPKVPGPGEPIRLHHSMCFGCGQDAPVGLRLQVIAGEDFQVTATMPVEDWMQGGPGVIHGGVLSAAFDEVMGNASILIGVPVVTVNLEIDYAKPIPLGTTLHFTAEVLGKSGRKVYVRSAAYFADPAVDPEATPVAAAFGIFVEINLRKHFENYKDGAVRAPE